MDIPISPLSGAGDIRFGMSRSEVRAQIATEYKSFKRSAQAMQPCDYFEKTGIFCYYDSLDVLEAIEFAPPAEPTLNGQKLLGLSFAVATKTLSALDDQIEQDVDGAIAHRLGVSIYAPLAKTNPSAPIESVLAFSLGYYD